MGSDNNYQEQRKRELRPLADALATVRGMQDIGIVNTGGNVYCVEGTLGAWRLDADEQGWSLTDDDGYSVAWGGWFVPDGHTHVAPDAYSLTLDPDTGALVPDECEAAAVAFASAHASLLAARQR